MRRSLRTAGRERSCVQAFKRLLQPFSLHAPEPLRALAGIDFRGIDAALGVDRDVVHPVEITGLVARTTEGADDFSALAQDDTRLVVGAVGDQQVALRRVLGKLNAAI